MRILIYSICLLLLFIFAICRCYFITYVVFYSPSSIMKTESKYLPKVTEAVNIIRSAFKNIMPQMNIYVYRALCKLSYGAMMGL